MGVVHDMLRRLSRMTLIASISVMLLSCVSTMACVGCSRESRLPVKAWELNPQESFGLITVKIKSTPLSCQSEDFQEQSCETEELGLSERITTSIGSSIVVGKVSGTSTTYVLTAAHVCSEKPRNEFRYTDQKGETFLIDAKQEVTDITVSDYSGNVRDATVYRIDSPNDLCLLETQGLWGKPFEVSESDPFVGQKTYNVAAPHRIWSPGMVLMMDGYYSGKSQTGFHHYTIPARPGSSGSPILTHDGKIIGMVQRAVVGFENLALSTSAQAIREIVATVPENVEKTPFISVPKLEALTF